ncbi:ankyrin-1 [Pseudoneurospora amorphoporcata]|uniref:Ankyrin-1 n=1 Tax=Pseudoneurospora amorphoporcata TaxID=241081 RepID=A0AAN6NJZ9_9PEZI|nr:ankyrin-1 [Pseudoneurospora amorphoporcata]
MDPLSVVCSIATLIQVSSDVLRYIITAKGALKERKRLSEQILACEFVLLQFQHFTDNEDETPMWAEKLKPLEVPDKSLYRLRVALEAIKAKLEPTKGLEKALFTLKWPFTEKDVEKHISTIQSEMSLLQMALNTDCSKIIRELYRGQVNRDNQTLFYPGIPGAGKTILTSIKPEDLIANLLKQLAQVATYSKVFIIVDALNKCQETGGYRAIFLSELFNLQAECKLNLFAISRFVPEIAGCFKDSILLEIRASEQDVRRYIDSRISQLPSFLLAQLHLYSLTGKRSPKAVRTVLRNLPTGSNAYDDAYRDLIGRIEGQAPSQVELAKQIEDMVLKQWFPDAMAEIAEICVTYLSFSIFEVGPCQSDGHYARGTPVETKRLILDFLQTESKVSRQDVPGQVTGVHLAACFGLRDSIVALLKNGNKPDLKDTHGRTPLSYAAERGYEEVVALFLANEGVNPDSTDSALGWTPLWYAVAGGQVAVVRLLLGKPIANRVDPNFRDFEYGWTPLSWAVANGHDVIVKLLLDKAGAAERGHRAAVKILLEKDSTDLVSRSKFGRTLLWFARARGHEGIVELLMANDPDDPNLERFQYGQMPLWYTAENGQEAIVKALLRSGADPNSESSYGRTPLSYAAERGHEGIAKLLLENDNGVNSDSKSKNGRTPLSWAARFGHKAIVKLLLMRDDVDPNSKSNRERTPLSYAAERGHDAVVRLLVARDGVELSSKDSEYGRTPLL